MKEYPLVKRLERLRDEKNRAALAKLRRGLGKRMGTPEMFPYVVPFLPEADSSRKAYFIVASLFALHPESAPRGTSMGKVFKTMRGNSDSMEKRFTTILSADIEDLGSHLRHAVTLAKSKNVKIDYHQLLYDLLKWDHPDHFVQLNWARDFWGYEKTENDKAE